MQKASANIPTFGTLTLTQGAVYYPFGLAIDTLSYQLPVATGTTANPYLYNGKELHTQLGLEWLDYGARYYDATVGRWWSVDPLAEKRNWLTPYQYAQNNPIMRIDADGMLDGWYTNADNVLKYDPSIHSQKDMKNAGVSGTFKGENVFGKSTDGKGFAGYSDGSFAVSFPSVDIISSPYNPLVGTNNFCDDMSKGILISAMTLSGSLALAGEGIGASIVSNTANELIGNMIPKDFNGENALKNTDAFDIASGAIVPTIGKSLGGAKGEIVGHFVDVLAQSGINFSIDERGITKTRNEFINNIATKTAGKLIVEGMPKKSPNYLKRGTDVFWNTLNGQLNRN